MEEYKCDVCLKLKTNNISFCIKNIFIFDVCLDCNNAPENYVLNKLNNYVDAKRKICSGCGKKKIIQMSGTCNKCTN